jgi:hypothetical protein
VLRCAIHAAAGPKRKKLQRRKPKRELKRNNF